MSDATTAAPAPAGDTTQGASPAPAPAASAASPAPAAPAPAPAASAAPAPAATHAPSAAPAAAPKDGEPGEKKDGDKATGAPESYEFTLPEGVKLDESVMGEFKNLAKELDLPQDKAQKLVDLGARMQSGNAEAIAAAVEAQGEKWAAEVKADPEIGGEKFDENLAVAKSALEKFGTPELKAMLVQTKLGNHPEVLRTFMRIGQAISQDGFVPGRTGGVEDAAKRFYS